MFPWAREAHLKPLTLNCNTQHKSNVARNGCSDGPYSFDAWELTLLHCCPLEMNQVTHAPTRATRPISDQCGTLPRPGPTLPMPHSIIHLARTSPLPLRAWLQHTTNFSDPTCTKVCNQPRSEHGLEIRQQPGDQEGSSKDPQGRGSRAAPSHHQAPLQKSSGWTKDMDCKGRILAHPLLFWPRSTEHSISVREQAH